jgi:hypothetical protein
MNKATTKSLFDKREGEGPAREEGRDDSDRCDGGPLAAGLLQLTQIRFQSDLEKKNDGAQLREEDHDLRPCDEVQEARAEGDSHEEFAKHRRLN